MAHQVSNVNVSASFDDASNEDVMIIPDGTVERCRALVVHGFEGCALLQRWPATAICPFTAARCSAVPSLSSARPALCSMTLATYVDPFDAAIWSSDCPYGDFILAPRPSSKPTAISRVF